MQSNEIISQRSIQIELIFRLLLKITVDGPPECDLINFCPPRGGKTTNFASFRQAGSNPRLQLRVRTLDPDRRVRTLNYYIGVRFHWPRTRRDRHPSGFEPYCAGPHGLNPVCCGGIDTPPAPPWIPDRQIPSNVNNSP